MLSDIEKTKTWQSILLDSMIGIWLTEFKMKILDNESFKIDKINKLKDIDVFNKNIETEVIVRVKKVFKDLVLNALSSYDISREISTMFTRMRYLSLQDLDKFRLMLMRNMHLIIPDDASSDTTQITKSDDIQHYYDVTIPFPEKDYDLIAFQLNNYVEMFSIDTDPTKNTKAIIFPPQEMYDLQAKFMAKHFEVIGDDSSGINMVDEENRQKTCLLSGRGVFIRNFFIPSNTLLFQSGYLYQGSASDIPENSIELIKNLIYLIPSTVNHAGNYVNFMNFFHQKLNAHSSMNLFKSAGIGKKLPLKKYFGEVVSTTVFKPNTEAFRNKLHCMWPFGDVKLPTKGTFNNGTWNTGIDQNIVYFNGDYLRSNFQRDQQIKALLKASAEDHKKQTKKRKKATKKDIKAIEKPAKIEKVKVERKEPIARSSTSTLVGSQTEE